ncbi:AtpZ/AtpI family protein [Pelosinus sp. sgz500959]|uniref:AtpZ/AtpI family protein n=1 Tax=Pelosinus sp. sgz500959 TaxID=3242472 RepID=UPI003671D245
MQKDYKELFDGLQTATTVGFYMVSSIIAGIFLGRLIDGYFGSQPWATIGGIVLGMITGLYTTYKKIMGGK